MTMQQILSTMRRAIADYRMIADGDSIAVGLSGGKDSVALVAALAAYRRFSPENSRSPPSPSTWGWAPTTHRWRPSAPR